jgi:hypothetical protein
MWSGAPRASRDGKNPSDVHSPIVIGGAVYVVADGALVRMKSEQSDAPH